MLNRKLAFLSETEYNVTVRECRRGHKSYNATHFNSLNAVLFCLLFCQLLIFVKINIFKKIISGISSQCQIVLIQFRPLWLLILISNAQAVQAHSPPIKLRQPKFWPDSDIMCESG